jgi:hypothetical protein
MGNQIGGTESTTRATEAKDRQITLTGTWCYWFKCPPPRTVARLRQCREHYLGVLARHGFKVGIKLKSSQTVPLFSFQGTAGELVMVRDSAVTQELHQTFGAGPGEKWIGFVSPPGAQRKPEFPKGQPDRLCYRYKLAVKPVRHMPQPLPLVVALRDKPFREHYLLDLRILATELGTVQTAVGALLRRPRSARRLRRR